MATTSSNDQRIVRVNEAAGLALLQFVDAATGAAKTKWVLYASPPADEREPRHRKRINRAGRIDLNRRPSAFGRATRFQLVPPPSGAPQNLIVFLHGRGDSHEPFAKLGAAMALPQTGMRTHVSFDVILTG